MAEKVIDEAILHIEVEDKKFFVRGIAETGNKEDRKWFLFEKDDQLPSAHPLMESQITSLRVKSYRNLSVLKGKLAPYLSEDKKSFEFNGTPLIADHEQSIKENG